MDIPVSPATLQLLCFQTAAQEAQGLLELDELCWLQQRASTHHEGFLLSRSQGSHHLLLGEVMKLPKLERRERTIQPMLGSGKLHFYQAAWDNFSLSFFNDVSEQHNSHLIPYR